MQSLNNKQRGFAIGTILLIVVLMAAVVGAIALGSRSNNSQSASQTSQINASTIVQEGINLRSGFERMVAGGTGMTTITFDTTATTGLFNPSTGGAAQQTPPPTALNTITNTWVYKATGGGAPVVKVKSVGLDATADYMTALVDIKQAVCQQINNILTGSTTIPAPADADNTSAKWAGATTTQDFSATADATLTGKSELCIETTDNKYVYFKVLAEQ